MPQIKASAAPPRRRIRAYAFDPGVSLDAESTFINEVTLQVKWEKDIPPDEDGPLAGSGPRALLPGPIGEYVEVIDADPASGIWYEPVDLNEPALLGQDGHAPSDGNPQFHQQMVYAVVMKTIEHFEEALGRPAAWRDYGAAAHENGQSRFIPRLRVYPHGLREANAYYSPSKIALLFGYFPAGGRSGAAPQDVGRNLPGGIVFTCLSHDVVAHETTHALLDGLHRRYMEASNPDVLAFHEAFADLVALLQHFTFPEVVRQQIARTRGDLSAYNMLGQLARQFGEAIGRRGALRDAIGRVDPKTGRWEPHVPDPAEYRQIQEPHERGAILVAAVFDAFIQVYQRRAADLYRIATGGTGVLPAGSIHPDLVDRLAREATKAARHLLRICVRALDYCPPVDLTFGEYLRAMITADYDLVADDRYGYRVALVDAFRRRGVYPPDVRSLSVDALLWYQPPVGSPLRDLKKLMEQGENLSIPEGLRPEQVLDEISLSWDVRSDRREAWRQARQNRIRIHTWLTRYLQLDPDQHEALARESGLRLRESDVRSIPRDEQGRPKVEVHSARPAWRVRENGSLGLDLVVELTQRRAGYFDQSEQEKADKEGPSRTPDFWFRGGCTLLVDAGSREVRYAIRKDIASENRLDRHRQFLKSPPSMSLAATYYRGRAAAEAGVDEPFATLHSEFP